MIERTVIAKCDRPECPSLLALRPNDTQPFISLATYGWQTDTDLIDDQVATICPRHLAWLERKKAAKTSTTTL